MTPDPFRALDRIDPPDQWDEITRRTGSDEVDVELEPVRVLRPRRRAAALVAAAAAIALVAGGLVATSGDEDDGVATTPSPAPGSDMPGPCPFVVEPGPPAQEVVPGQAPIEPPLALADVAVEDRSVDLTPWTRGSWGSTTWEGVETTVSVYADGGTTLTPLGPWTDARLVDDARGRELLIVGTNVIEGSPACRTVQVAFRAGLSEADAALRQEAVDAGEDGEAVADLIDLEAYGAQHEERVARALAAVRLVEPRPDVPDPCATLVDADDPPAPPATEPAEPAPPFTFGGETADGRAYTVEAVVEDGEDVVRVEVEGGDGGGGGSRPDGPGDRGWSWTGDDAGIAVGWRPADAVATAAVRPDGTLATAGLALSPGGTLYALPDVGQVPGPDGEQEAWPIVHCTAAGKESTSDLTQAVLDARLEEGTAMAERDEELSDEIEEEARAYQERLECAADPAACPEATTTVPTPGPMTWEGRLVDGRTYRVEVDGDVVTAFVDGREVNPGVDTEVPDWPAGSDDGSASAVGFELSPNPDDGPRDWVLVGARPPGAVETYVRGPDGDMVAVRSLTLSPDGRFYALHGLELDFMEDPETPWPVVHTTTDGEVVELP